MSIYIGVVRTAYGLRSTRKVAVSIILTCWMEKMKLNLSKKKRRQYAKENIGVHLGISMNFARNSIKETWKV